jgi:multicomponent Na+:H+ antiporter subunit G
MDTVDGLVAVLLIVGVIIRLIASIGMVRFGDVYMRMHASTTASTLGLLFILVATALHFGDALITIKLIALGAIYFFTAPIGTQVLAHAESEGDLDRPNGRSRRDRVTPSFD